MQVDHVPASAINFAE